MFSFTTTVTLHHVTPLPPCISLSHALPYLHNHQLLVRLDPDFASCESLPADAACPNAKRYKVTDHMHALPAGLWGTTVSFTAEMTDMDDGVLWIVKAPLGLVSTTTWKLQRTETLGEERVAGLRGLEERGEWSLVEDVEIRANRMLAGTVQAKCEENWRGSHGKLVAHLLDGLAKSQIHSGG